METYIVKRDGKHEVFTIDKIKAAISKSFLASGAFATEEVMTGILSHLNIQSGISVEEIQNQVEVALMAEGYYQVAKTYMLYRNRHAEDRETKSKLEFLMGYCQAANAAEGSKFDANANVENKNIATLIGELPKKGFIRLNRRLLCDRIRQMYGKEVADKYMSLLHQHFIYKNDETNLANYCASITMYPWLLGGTKSIGGNATQPTNLKAFCGGFINITQNAKKVFFIGTFTAGGLKVHVEDGKLVIDQEGKKKKLIDTVEQITFSGEYARKTGQPVMYITERAVFELREDGVYLTEVAPGIDVKTQVLALMDFEPKIPAEGVKTMDERIFKDELMGLKK